MREFAYKKAFEMRKAKPWKKLDNGRMFAVRLKSGEIRFCFYVSVPRDGINSFFMLSETKGFQAVYKFYCRNYQDNSFLDYVEYTNNQDAIIINFDNKSSLAPSEKEYITDFMKKNSISNRGRHIYPIIRNYQPQHIPWPIRNDEDFERTGECITAALTVNEVLSGIHRMDVYLPTIDEIIDGTAKEIPLIDSQEHSFSSKGYHMPKILDLKYPIPKWNDLEVARMRHSKRNGNVWLSELFFLPEEMIEDGAEINEFDEPVEAPFVPYFLNIIDEESGIMLGMENSHSVKKPFDSLKQLFVEQIAAHGKPRKILVRCDRAEAFFKGICKQLDIKLEKVEDHEILDYFRKDMQAHWMRNNGCSDEEIADVIGEPWGEDEIDPDKNEYEERLENADTDEDLQELDIEKWLNMIEQAVKLDLLSKIKEEEFSVLIDIMLSYDIAPELEAKLKAEYRRRRKQNRNRR